MINLLVALKVIFFRTVCLSKDQNYYWWKSIGFRILGHFQLYEKRHYRFLAKQIQRGGTACDIGAHFGIYSQLFLERVGEQGKVFIFEPFAPAFDILVSRFKNEQNCSCLPFAISNENKSNLWLNVPKLCGLVPEPALASVNEEKKSDFDYPIATRTLDSFIVELAGLSIVKADVEGHEIPLIEGALNCLERYRPLVVFEDNGIDVARIEMYQKLLDKLNYSLCFLNNSNKLEVLKFDNIPKDNNFYLAPAEKLSHINSA